MHRRGMGVVRRRGSTLKALLAAALCLVATVSGRGAAAVVVTPTLVDDAQQLMRALSEAGQEPRSILMSPTGVYLLEQPLALPPGVAIEILTDKSASGSGEAALATIACSDAGFPAFLLPHGGRDVRMGNLRVVNCSVLMTLMSTAEEESLEPYTVTLQGIDLWDSGLLVVPVAQPVSVLVEDCSSYVTQTPSEERPVPQPFAPALITLSGSVASLSVSRSVFNGKEVRQAGCTPLRLRGRRTPSHSPSSACM